MNGNRILVALLVTGSLWPAIIIHAASDLFSGEMSFHALAGGGDAGRETPGGGSQQAVLLGA